MAKCEYCGKSVSMPFICSLCEGKYCAKHRLPENHECINLYKFQTDEYRQQKRQKQANLEQQTFVPQDPPQIDRLGLDNSSYWASSLQLYNIIYLGLLLTLTTYLQSMLFIKLDIVFFTYFVLSGVLLGILGALVVFYARKYANYPISTEPAYVFWKIGVIITLVSAAIKGLLSGEFFLLFLPGFFIPMNFYDDRKNSVSVTITTAAYFFVGIVFKITAKLLPLTTVLSRAFVFQLPQMAAAFIILGILNLIVEGRILYHSSKLLFIVSIASAILLYFYVLF